jgi:hypothetical protein
MFKSWKTSLAGLIALLGGVLTIVQGNVTGGVTAIVAGIGLFAAKDKNVTGGTTQQ